ncbi:MAG: hypothetical protein GF355_15850 [Candidatus Eisenbacteria bacterium]|nr:hypothetical protein [Candidatus Eisenbacteria bacterium]
MGMRYFLNDGMAFRPVVQFGWESETSEPQSDQLSDDKMSDFVLGLEGFLEKHKDIGIPALSPWIGAGAGFTVASSKHEPSVVDDPPTGTLTEETSSMFRFSLLGAAGFEWAFTKGLSLGGSYVVGLAYGTSKSEETRINNAGSEETETVSEGSSFNIGFDTASLHLTVNF